MAKLLGVQTFKGFIIFTGQKIVGSTFFWGQHFWGSTFIRRSKKLGDKIFEGSYFVFEGLKMLGKIKILGVKN